MTTPTAPTPTPAALRAAIARIARRFQQDEHAAVGTIRLAGIAADLAAHVERLTAENDALYRAVGDLTATTARIAETTARLADRVAALDAAANYPGTR